MTDESTLLREFKRNPEETLRVSVRTFHRKAFVDFRLYYEDEKGELLPTKKGVTVTADLWDSFRGAVAAAEGELEKRGLWHPEGETA